jgi:hypothetical protein
LIPHMEVATSAFGTFETCQPPWKLSAYRGGPEVIGAQPKRRF